MSRTRWSAAFTSRRAISCPKRELAERKNTVASSRPEAGLESSAAESSAFGIEARRHLRRCGADGCGSDFLKSGRRSFPQPGTPGSKKTAPVRNESGEVSRLGKSDQERRKI